MQVLPRVLNSLGWSGTVFRRALEQLQSMYEGCRKLSLAKRRSQQLAKLKFLSAVSNGWKVLLSPRLRKCRRHMTPAFFIYAGMKLKDLTTSSYATSFHDVILLASISYPTSNSLWCHIKQHLSLKGIPRPRTDFDGVEYFYHSSRHTYFCILSTTGREYSRCRW